MLFLVHTVFTRPESLSDTELSAWREAERAAAADLQARGIIRELWRDTGSGAAWGVWSIPEGEDLLAYQAELPCFPFMQSTTYPIVEHPNRVVVPLTPQENL